jgi:integrase
MRNTAKLSVNLAAAVQSVGEQVAQALTLDELVRAYDAQACAAESFRLRKWLNALGKLSAWEISTEQLSAAAQAMMDAGYKASSPNRDLSALGTVYRWAISRRLCPKGFRSPTVGVQRYKEDIRRVYVTDAEVAALRRCSLAYRDRRFGVFVNLLLDTGARKGELYQRRWGEVDLIARQILLPTSKNGQPRTLHFSEATRERGGRAKLNTPISGRAAPMGEDRARVFRSTEDEQTTTPEPLSGIQGQGGHRGFGR